MSPLGVFIAWPGLALVPAALFLALYRASRRGLVIAVALAWAGYAAYEYGMHRRWLCTGECNIRVDLLLIYPALLLVSAAAAVAGARTIRRGRGRGPPSP
jgi:hypothetical protein